jgi:hypothetical protein
MRLLANDNGLAGVNELPPKRDLLERHKGLRLAFSQQGQLFLPWGDSECLDPSLFHHMQAIEPNRLVAFNQRRSVMATLLGSPLFGSPLFWGPIRGSENISRLLKGARAAFHSSLVGSADVSFQFQTKVPIHEGTERGAVWQASCRRCVVAGKR